MRTYTSERLGRSIRANQSMDGPTREFKVPLMSTLKPKVATARLHSMPIVVWLVLGFGVVIGAFAAASVVSLRSTRDATVDLEKMQLEFEPLSRSVRDLGDGVATYDRAVLAYLRADTPDNRATTVAAAERLSHAASQMQEVDAAEESPQVQPLLQRIADHQAQGFRLMNMQDERRRAIAGLESAFAALIAARRARADPASSSATASWRGPRLRSWRAPWKPPDTTCRAS